ncbi:putative transcriptional regulator [Buttiauxella ferragutiae ATCC 51602]|uniref:Transcriptional regulator n=1 Tax=Buttiauxella ferragutiae ATCC 51602 TaxID=1354252 RepID=A0ABX2WER7_9ENTR|nr:putative transcriptional regulator [Buttiauxella ferragutiae ATCC 51602]
MHTCSINKSHFENSTMSLSGNILRFKKGNNKIKLSKNQSKLMACLISEGNEKRKIINYIWGGEDCKSRGNSYSQLVFKTKQLFIKNGLPVDFIMTIPNYGLCINKNHTNKKNSQADQATFSTLNDPGIYQ